MASLSHSEQEATLPGSDSESREQPKRIDEPLHLVHHHPGYLRLRAEAFVQPEDSSVVTAAQTAAETALGFRSWSHNPKTGSVVVEYDSATLDADDLLKRIAKSAGFRGVETSTGGKTNRQELTGERADLRELVPLTLLALSVVSFVLDKDRGRLPDWNNTLYHSYRVFMQWHRREVRTRERDARQNEEARGSHHESDIRL
jgi:hypothetical protein